MKKFITSINTFVLSPVKKLRMFFVVVEFQFYVVKNVDRTNDNYGRSVRTSIHLVQVFFVDLEFSWVRFKSVVTL